MPTRLPLLVVTCWLALTTSAEAHKLCLKAEKRQGKLYVEAWYDDDTPADRAKIKVTQSDQLVLEGVTNERGVWSADCPPTGAYLVEANDGGGHTAHAQFVIQPTDEPQQAGETRQEVEVRRTWGVVLGLGAVALLVLAGRLFLRRRPFAASA